jgi:predicted small secreted protein
MFRYFLLAGVVLVSACNTMAGLGDDLAYYGSTFANYARHTGAAGSGTSSPPLDASASGPSVSAPPAAPAPRTGPLAFAAGERVTLVKPAILRDQPSLDGAIVGYGRPGDTYQVIAQQHDWVEIGADQKPLAWVFDTFLTVATAQN